MTVGEPPPLTTTLISVLFGWFVVLSIFSNTVANLPNEIAHIYEEIQAKDKALLELQKGIMQRDGLMQKFIKLNGSHVPNPKEEGYSNHIRKAYAQINILQDEKITFSQKALDLVCIHIITCLFLRTMIPSAKVCPYGNASIVVFSTARFYCDFMHVFILCLGSSTSMPSCGATLKKQTLC